MRENWRLHFRRDVDRLVGDLGTEVANWKKARGVQMAICAFRGWEVFLAEEGKGGPWVLAPTLRGLAQPHHVH